MPTLDELQAQLAALTQRVNEITAPPDDYYTHRFSGEEIDNAVDRVKATPGSGAITAGDVGAAQSPLLSDVILYVNGTSGSDSNPGTQYEPFKTIQAAINSLPKNLGEHSVTIDVSDGTYDEDVVVSGFIGAYTGENDQLSTGLFITGRATVRSIRFVNNLVPTIRTRHVSVSGGALGDTLMEAGTGVLVQGCQYVLFSEGSISNCKIGVQVGSYSSCGGSSFYAQLGSITNCSEVAVFSQGQNYVYVTEMTGNGNTLGIRSWYGSRVATKGSIPGATTAQEIYGAYIDTL